MKCVSYLITAGRIPAREGRFILAQFRIQSILAKVASMTGVVPSMEERTMAAGFYGLSISQHIRK